MEVVQRQLTLFQYQAVRHGGEEHMDAVHLHVKHLTGVAGALIDYLPVRLHTFPERGEAGDGGVEVYGCAWIAAAENIAGASG